MTSLRRACTALAAVAALSSGLLIVDDAAAFCRSTSCTGDCPRDIDGCKTEGAVLYWPTLCVGFSLQRDGSAHIPFEDSKRIVQDGFVAWSDIECPDGGYASMAFTQLKDVECHRAEYNQSGANANVIMFQDNRWTYSGVDNTLAKTTVTYDTDTGEIFDADIELNHAYNEFTTGDDNVVYDLQSITTHEIGHFIGLDHTPDFLATMNAGYEEGTTDLRSVEEDDMMAVCAAYPSERDGVCATKPNGGFSKYCDGDEPAPEEEASCHIGAAAGAARRHPGGSSRAAWLGLALGASLLLRRRRAGRMTT
jgi:hypothetical protein